jgi:hypothetical protein
MNSDDDAVRERADLERLARQLRQAAAIAFKTHPWFAPSLDDCRVDAERLLACDDGWSRHDLRRLVLARGALLLRTWDGLSASLRRRGPGDQM